MPPKKKGGKKGKKGKKGKGSGKKSRPTSAAEEKPLDQATKDYYLVQIRDLENRIAKYFVVCISSNFNEFETSVIVIFI